jgi:hypothetical protein
MLFQKRAVRTKLAIYVFIIIRTVFMCLDIAGMLLTWWYKVWHEIMLKQYISIINIWDNVDGCFVLENTLNIYGEILLKQKSKCVQCRSTLWIVHLWWWMLFQKRAVRTKLAIYVFIIIRNVFICVLI